MFAFTSTAKGFLGVGLLLASPLAASAQSALAPQAGEYSLAGALPGDQITPQLAIGPAGGYVVWEDNATDGDGGGISARRLVNNLSGLLAPFRVNLQGVGIQRNPQLALLKSGGAVFAWQSSEAKADRVYVRFLNADGTFATGDIVVASSSGQLLTPALAVLAGGDVVVVWSDAGRDGDLQGVFAQRLSAAGQKLGADFQVHQQVEFNQRSPAIAALGGGGFVVAWISELQRSDRSVDVHARVFDAGAQAVGDEFRASTTDRLCANPTLAARADGGFTLAWAERVVTTAPEGKVAADWDVFLRCFAGAALSPGAATRVNTSTERDQFAPRMATLGSSHLVVWTSVGQDGSREGVFGQFVDDHGDLVGEEFRVNTTTLSQQLYPTVASDGQNQVLVAWSGFTYGTSFDIFAQRYSAALTLPKPAAPFVSALSASRLSVTWPELAGYSVDGYELLIDDSSTPVAVSGNMYVLTRLAPASTHNFQLRYRLANGALSEYSDAATGTTWDEDANADQLPDDWQARYWGAAPANWAAADADSDGDGATNLREFLAGTDPRDAGSALRLELVATGQGRRLAWSTQPGFIYQVQTSTSLGGWSDLGSPRFAAGTSDSIPVDGAQPLGYYRVIRLR
jgi:hypothetical protein